MQKLLSWLMRTVVLVTAFASATPAQAWNLYGYVKNSSGVGLTGFTVNLTGSTTGTTTTGSGGYFSFVVNDGSYTVTPVKANYTFSPPSQSLTISGASRPTTDFIATLTPTTFSISGYVYNSTGAGMTGVTVTLGGAGSGTTTTGSGGYYSFSSQPNGSYTVTPTYTNWTFTPTQRSVTVSGAPVSVPSFTGTQTPTSWSISGYVYNSSGAGMTGVTVSLGGAGSGTTTTGSGGYYSFASRTNGSYTVTPSYTNWVFTPAQRSVTVSGAPASVGDFTGTQSATSWSISGYVYNSSGAGMTGVTVTLGGAGSGTTTTGSGGYYSFANRTNGSYTVTPSYTNWTFSPPQQSVTVSGAPASVGDFTGTQTPTSWSISGYVYNSSGAGMTGVTVTLGGAGSATTTTGSGGYYSFANRTNGSYTVTPSYTNWTFSPPQQSVTVTGAPVSVPSFTGTQTPTSWSISGYVKNGTGGGMSGVTVTLGGAGTASTTTGSGGYYSFAAQPNGSYSVTPSYSGWNFAPSQQSVTVSGAPVSVPDFIGTQSTYSISGTVKNGSGVGMVGVTMTLSGAGSGTVTTGTGGSYSFSNKANGSYVVTPTYAGWSFSPPLQTAVVNGSSVTVPDFVGTQSVYTISGYVKNSSGVGMSGVTVTLGGTGSGTTTTAAGGAYSFAGRVNGSYTLTPSSSGYTFAPPQQTVAVNGAPVSVPDFVGTNTPPTSFTVSGTVRSRRFPFSGIPGATVGADTGQTTTTAADGTYSLAAVPQGTRTLTASRADYWATGSSTSASQVVSVSTNTTGVNFTDFACQGTALASISVDKTSAAPGDLINVTVTLKNTNFALADVTSYLDLSFSDAKLTAATPTGTGWTNLSASPSGSPIWGIDSSGNSIPIPSSPEYLISGVRTGALGAGATVSFNLTLAVKPAASPGTVVLKYRATVGDSRDPASAGTGTLDQQGYNVRELPITVSSPTGVTETWTDVTFRGATYSISLVRDVTEPSLANRPLRGWPGTIRGIVFSPAGVLTPFEEFAAAFLAENRLVLDQDLQNLVPNPTDWVATSQPTPECRVEDQASTCSGTRDRYCLLRSTAADAARFSWVYYDGWTGAGGMDDPDERRRRWRDVFMELAVGVDEMTRTPDAVQKRTISDYFDLLSTINAVGEPGWEAARLTLGRISIGGAVSGTEVVNLLKYLITGVQSSQTLSISQKLTKTRFLTDFKGKAATGVALGTALSWAGEVFGALAAQSEICAESYARLDAIESVLLDTPDVDPEALCALSSVRDTLPRLEQSWLGVLDYAISRGAAASWTDYIAVCSESVISQWGGTMGQALADQLVKGLSIQTKNALRFAGPLGAALPEIWSSLNDMIKLARVSSLQATLQWHLSRSLNTPGVVGALTETDLDALRRLVRVSQELASCQAGRYLTMTEGHWYSVAVLDPVGALAWVTTKLGSLGAVRTEMEARQAKWTGAMRDRISGSSYFTSPEVMAALEEATSARIPVGAGNSLPSVRVLSAPPTVRQGEYVVIEVEVRNDGADTGLSYFDISSSNNVPYVTIFPHDDLHRYEIGELIWSQSGGQMAASNRLYSFVTPSFAGQSVRRYSIGYFPLTTGSFWLRLRASMANPLSPGGFARFPASGPADQQGWPVLVVNTTVSANVPPEITTSAPSGSSVTLGTSQTSATFTVIGVDPDGDPVTYAWFIDDGRRSELNTLTVAAPELTAGPHTVTAVVTDGRSVSTRTWSLTVEPTGPPCSTPPAPVVTSPASAGNGTPYSVSWSGGCAGCEFELQEADNPSFAGAVTLTAQGTSASFSHWVASPTSYHYRAVAKVSCNGSILRSQWSNTTTVGVSASCAAPARPVLVTPGTATSGETYTVTGGIAAAGLTFDVEEATSASFADAIRISTATGAAAFVHVVSADTGYFYRMRSVANCAASTWSDAGIVTVRAWRRVTVFRSGTGSGLVTSSPSGIQCGPSCSSLFEPDSAVQLTVVPAPGSAFRGWSGASCAGTGTCAVVLDADKSATANFDLSPVTVATGSATGIGPKDATLGGSVNPSGQATDTGFHFGLSPEYGGNVRSATLGGTSAQSISATVSDLNCSTTYHYRAWASSSAGIVFGEDREFATSACPGLGITARDVSVFPPSLNNPVPSAFTESGKIYYFGGMVPNVDPYQANAAIRAYDTVGNSWSTLSATLPYPDWDYNVQAQIVSGRYVFGPGYSTGDGGGWASHSKVITGLLSSGVGTESASFPYSTDWNVGSCLAGGKVYFFGGHNGGNNNGIWEYDPSTGLLTAVANMVVTGNGVHATLGTDGWIYYWRSWDGSSNWNAIERFNPVTRAVELRSSVVPYTDNIGASHLFHVASESAIYFFRGELNPKLYKYLYLTDSLSDTGLVVPGNYTVTTATRDASDERSVYVPRLGGTTSDPWILTKLTLSLVSSATVSLGVSDPNAAEAGLAPGQFTVTRTGSTTSALTVAYTVGGSATAGADYTSLSGAVTIPAGASSATISVVPVDDLLVEGSETVTVTLASGGGYTLGTPTSGTVTIADNDVAPSFSLAVSKPGTGTGTVTSSPAGIDCGATCSAAFTAGTPVVLTATAGADSAFSGWSGEGCTGTGTCQVTMSQARSLAATFSPLSSTCSPLLLADFTSGGMTGWQTWVTGWSVSGGLLRTTNTTPMVRTEATWTAGSSWTDYIAKADVRMESAYAPSSAELRTRYVDDTHYCTCTLMRDYSQTSLVLGDSVNGARAQKALTLAVNTWYSVQATVSGSTLTCEIVGDPTSRISAAHAGPAAGTVALRNAHVPVSFDNVSVRKAPTSVALQDFTAGTSPAGWTVGGGSASYSGGVLNLNSGCVKLPGTFSRADGLAVEADVRINNGGAGDFYVYALHDDVTNCNLGPLTRGYWFGFYPSGSDNPVDVIGSVSGGVRTAIGSVPTTITAGQWVRVRVEMGKDGRLRTLLNGVERNSVPSALHQGGGVALASWGSVDLDNLRIETLPGSCGTQAAGANFYTSGPCRVVDTRSTSAPIVGGQETRVVSVVGGTCGIPATAKALALNVTSVSPATAGYLSLFPGDQTKPTASSVNFRQSQIKANNAIVPIGSDGTLGIFNGASGTTHVLVDVVGFFQ